MMYKLQVLAITFLFSLFSTTIHARDDYVNSNEEKVIGDMAEELNAGTGINQELAHPSYATADKSSVLAGPEQVETLTIQSESEMSDGTKAIIGCLVLGPICLAVAYAVLLGCVHPGSNIC